MNMVKLICQDCGRTVRAPQDYDPASVCRECQGELLDESESTYEEEDSEDEDETEDSEGIETEEVFQCVKCQSYFPEDELISYCKPCHTKTMKTLIVEKIVEKPIYYSPSHPQQPPMSINDKSRFD